MKRALFAALGLLVALQAPVAGQLYQGTPPSTGQFDFVGASPAVAGTFGVYVGPYTGDLLGDGFGQFSIYCVDYLNYAQDLDRVNLSPLSGSLGNTRIGSSALSVNAPMRYMQAAYLSSLFDSWQDYGTDRRTVWSGLHAAIWDITSDQSGLGGTGNAVASLRTAFLTDAATNYASVNPDEWFVITNADLAGGGQEFLARRSVPEPATVLLLLSGLALLVGVSRERILGVANL